MSVSRSDKVCINRNVLLKLLSLFVALCFVFSNYAGFVSHAENGQFVISMGVNNTTPNIGEEITYTIKYSYPSTSGGAFNNCVISTALPANLTFTGFDVNVSGCVTAQNGSNLTFTFATMAPGTTGIVKFKAKVGTPGQTISNGKNVSVTIHSSIAADGTTSLDSNNVEVIAKANVAANWSITKEKTSPGCDPALDNNVTYQINLKGNTNPSALDIKDITVSDILPTGATFVSASDGGVYNSSTGKVDWSVPSLAYASAKVLTVVVKYTSDKFLVNSTVRNNVIANGKQIDNTVLAQISAFAEHKLVEPIYSVGTFVKNSRQNDDRYSTGQLAKFNLDGIGNTGNVPIDKYEVVDTIPAGANGIKLTQISTGGYSQSANVAVSYKTNLNNADWNNWRTVTSNTILNVADLALQSDEYVTFVKWVITPASGSQFASGFANTSALNVFGTVLAQKGTTITNTAKLDAFIYNEGTSSYINKATKDASKSIRVIEEQPWVVSQKSAYSDSSYQTPCTKFNYNDRVYFSLFAKNHDYATGNYENPVLYDEFGNIFTDVQYEGYKTNSSLTVDPSVSISGNQVRANVTGSLKPGEYVEIRCSALIVDKTTTGFYNNALYVSTLDETTVFENTTTGDAQNSFGFSDGKTRKWMKSDVNIYVKFVGKLTSELKIKGQNDTDFGVHVQPDTTTTSEGGIVDYQLKISNSESNGTISNLIVIDKLSAIGDTGVVDTSPRGSEWSPSLVNVITGANGAALPADTKVYYTTKENPSCIELTNPVAYMKDDNSAEGWTLTPPADITTVKAIKIVFDKTQFKTASDSVTIQWPMRAPVGSPENKVAWDSFGYAATYPDGTINSEGKTEDIQSAFLPTEPNKVGFTITKTENSIVGDRVWEDINRNGIQDADEPGINGVLVNLKKFGTNDIVAYTRTADNFSGDAGYYLFPKLPDGNYYVEFVYPNNTKDADKLMLTPQAQGSDSTIDSNKTSDPVAYTGAGYDNGNNSVKTEPFAITNSSDLSVDLGLYRYGEIGDTVWNDINQNGIQDSGETGISGVIVNLYDSSDTLITTTTTDIKGNYIFKNLKPDTYKVEFINPGKNNESNRFAFSPKSAGADNTKDSDGDYSLNNIGNSAVATVALKSGEVRHDIDQGMYAGSIGNFVWQDSNANGIQDSGEIGISGVTVTLYKNDGITKATDIFGTAVSPTTTDEYGKYLFSNIGPGNYIVSFAKPSGYAKSSPKHVDATGTDSDITDKSTTEPYTTDSFALSAGSNNDTIDAGFYKFCSVGDTVWNDYDADGVQDTGEPGINGVTVRLLDENKHPVTDGNGHTVGDVKTALKDGKNGQYSFTSLEPGNYYITFVNPGVSNATKRYLFSPQGQGTLRDKDSDGIYSTQNGDEATTKPFTLTSGSSNNNIDQGMFAGSIGDFVWNDKNANGVQDSGEAGFSGVTVSLYDSTGTTIAKDIDGNNVTNIKTGADGKYQFNNLSAGDYVVKFDVSTVSGGFNGNCSPANAGGDDAKDSDIISRSGNIFSTVAVTISTDQRHFDTDAGLYQYATIGDFVWEDKDADGVQDTGEAGISNVKVTLLDSTGIAVTNNAKGTDISNIKTDSAGKYKFDNLVPGDYYVQFEKPDGTYFVSPKGTGTATDSDIDVSTLKSGKVTLISGQTNNDIDAGFYRTASIGNYVWDDTNGDGIQNDGNTKISGVKVTLLDSTGNTRAKDINGADIPDQFTDSDGKYMFSNLKPGSYYVKFKKPTGFDAETLLNKGTTDKDSNIDNTFKSNKITVISNQIEDTVDAGFVKNAHIGDFVWNDTNANGIQDSGEAGIAGTTVNLMDSTGTNVIATTTTDATGYYGFSVRPDTYIVRFRIPDGYSNFSPYNAGTDQTKNSKITPTDLTYGKTEKFAVASGETNTTIDAGFYKITSIGNFVWNDTNADGIQGAGETGIPNVSVTLYDNSNNIITTATTDANGKYLFANLTPGTYHIGFNAIPAGFDTVSPQESGLNRENDSNISVTTFMSGDITLASGEYNQTIDAGFYKRCSIGDYVWEDSNANGIQDLGEKGIAGIKVSLLDGSGNQTGKTTTTDASGKYTFNGLVPGAYSISIEKPDGYYASPLLTAGSTASTDSDIDRDTFTTPVVTLLSGQINNDLDAGLFKKVSVGDYVWEDLNADGQQGSTESGIANAKVSLYDLNNNLISSKLTDSNGKYIFENLTPNKYYIVFNMPNGFNRVSEKMFGSDSSIDSDISTSSPYKTDEIELKSGDAKTTIDAGFYKTASLGDFVWDDLNADGIQDNGEKGIQGVIVNLLDSNGDTIRTSSTDADGHYVFDSLKPGKYKVQIVKPLEYTDVSPKNAVADTASDSNIYTSTLTTDEIGIFSGQYNDTIDAGLFKRASVGNYVWYDDNSNGIQDEAGERGVNGVIVNLLDKDGKISDTKIAANNISGKSGYYSFTGLIPDKYTIEFSNIPEGYLVSKLKATSDSTKDSDADPTTLKTEQFTLVSGQVDDTRDMGIRFNANAEKTVGMTDLTQSKATLTTNGDREKFSFCIGFDVPQDCFALKVEDKLDAGLTVSNAQDDIKIYNGTTDVSGKFDIAYNKSSNTVVVQPKNILDATKGRYFVKFRCGITQGVKISNYPNQQIPNTADVTINTTVLTTNIVYVKPSYGEIAGVVWIDTNKDGVVNPGTEKGINDVIVDLYASDGTHLDVQQTKSDTSGKPGNYEFDYLNPGSYYLEFSQLPLAYFTTHPEMGTPDSSGGTLKYRTKIIAINDVNQTPLWDVGIANTNPNPKTLAEPNKYLFSSIMMVMLSSLIFLTGRSIIKILRNKKILRYKVR